MALLKGSPTLSSVID